MLFCLNFPQSRHLPRSDTFGRRRKPRDSISGARRGMLRTLGMGGLGRQLSSGRSAARETTATLAAQTSFPDECVNFF